MDRKEKRKKKKKLIFILISIIILILIILFVKNFYKEQKLNNNDINNITDEIGQYELPDTTYKDMEVSSISMEYLTDNNETEVTMLIVNNTSNNVKEEMLAVYLINDDSEIIGKTQTYISSLNAGSEYSISVILKGDLTSTTQIKLEEIEK